MFATPAQLNLIRILAAKKGQTANQARLDYGFNPGQMFSSADASSLINHLKGLNIEDAQKADAAYRFKTTGQIGVGIRVRHERFGPGTVQGIVKKEAVVKFDQDANGYRTFSTKSLAAMEG